MIIGTQYSVYSHNLKFACTEKWLHCVCVTRLTTRNPVSVTFVQSSACSMNKFIVRLPSGSQPKKETNKPRTANQRGQSTQVYLDLGQKSLGKTRKCSLCSMFYIIDDEDDVRSHVEFCKKVPTHSWDMYVTACHPVDTHSYPRY